MKTHPLALALSFAAMLAVAAAVRWRGHHAAPDDIAPIGRAEHRQRSSDVNATALQMAARPRDEIARWLSTLPLSERDKALSILVAESGKSDPLLALEHALRIQSPALRDECAGLAMAYLYERDPHGALERMMAESNPAIRAAMAKRLLPALAESHAEDAIGLLATGTLDDASHFPTLVANVVQRWAQKDPVAAAGWITTIEEPDLRASSAAALAAVWMQRDPGQMEEWLSAHPDQPNVADLLRARPGRDSMKNHQEDASHAETYAPDDTIVSEPCGDDPPQDD
ncbi:hypothetical protein KBB96_08815 [Luteolibacter ambystomatis]|uniref:HEAT repeat domain-containing protein n=1 Tax=Luteolibacter ambystomatis TaxID=2824561 RepID=A0A975J2R2_9BACT|nr:hypothetical protein [Luteolibacter ambystomatis]QUE52978.1 hypothetical protein KBB96_08815 [Luteolibacter ambystomatis]